MPFNVFVRFLPKKGIFIMFEILVQLRTLFIQSGKTQQVLAEETGCAASTISHIITGKTENVKLQTFIDLAEALGAELALVTEHSKQAISQQDVTYYRNELAKRDDTIAELKADLAKVTEHYIRTQGDAHEDKHQLWEQVELLREQLQRKDRYIDILIETASKGGDLKAVDVKVDKR